jgi:hypothetical protein
MIHPSIMLTCDDDGQDDDSEMGQDDDLAALLKQTLLRITDIF